MLLMLVLVMPALLCYLQLLLYRFIEDLQNQFEQICLIHVELLEYVSLFCFSL